MLRIMPMNNPANTAQIGRGPFAVLRRAKNVKNANDAERNALLDDAERIETWCANLVLGAIVLEAVVWISPLCPFLFKLGNFVADAAVAIGIYGEVRFGHIAGDILKMRLAEAIERAAKIEQLTAWRHVPKDKRGRLIEFLRKLDVLVILLIEYQSGDAEAFSYAAEIAKVFQEAGIAVRGGGNWDIRSTIFGLHIAGKPEINMASLQLELENAGISVGGFRDNTAMARLVGDPSPNLYIFVAPKMPPTFD
jgi:hypothetical protein